MSVIEETTVLVVGKGGTSGAMEGMFRNRKDYRLVSLPSEADLMVFTGGEDVCPVLYGEATQKGTSSNIMRDFEEIAALRYALDNDIPLAGICRGAQFLNVMAGGRLYQDVSCHCGNFAQHDAQLADGKIVKVNSYHHQMMIPSERMKHDVLMWANNSARDKHTNSAIALETEAVYYYGMNALCFQPHPEFMTQDDTRETFFNLLEEYVLA